MKTDQLRSRCKRQGRPDLHARDKQPAIEQRGKPWGVQGVVRDITSRGKREACDRADQRALSEYDACWNKVDQLAQTLGTARDLGGDFLRGSKSLPFVGSCDGMFVLCTTAARRARRGLRLGRRRRNRCLGTAPICRSISADQTPTVSTNQIIITNDYMKRDGGPSGLLVGPDNDLDRNHRSPRRWR